MLFIGSDHAGFELKEAFKTEFRSRGIEFQDCGTNSVDSCHYPEYASIVAKKVQQQENAKGLLICGSGIGVDMVANRFKNVRSALCRDEEDAILSRKHNNSNVLCLGARKTSKQAALQIFDLWMKTEFEGGRHQARVDLFTQLGE